MTNSHYYRRDELQHNILDKVWIIFITILLFIISTPFELAQSGFVYLFKGAALAIIITYAIVLRGAGLSKVLLLPLIVCIIILVLNTVGNWSERALIGLVTIALGALAGQLRSAVWNNELEKALKYLLIINIAGFMASYSYFYIAGNVLDLHGMIFPNPSRAETFGQFARNSGFHTEPGTYAQWNLMILFLYSIITGRLFHSLTFLTLATCFLTVSLWALVGITIYLIALSVETIFDRSKTKYLRYASSLMAVTLSITLYYQFSSADAIISVFRYLELKGSFTTESGLDKVRAAQFFYNELNHLILVGKPIDPGFCPNCISPQDAGLGMNGVYYLGAAISVAIFAISFFKLLIWRGLAFAIPLGLLLVWKAHFYDPLLWLIIGYILSLGLSKMELRPRSGRIIHE